jgi:hypothetical protein
MHVLAGGHVQPARIVQWVAGSSYGAQRVVVQLDSPQGDVSRARIPLPAGAATRIARGAPVYVGVLGRRAVMVTWTKTNRMVAYPGVIGAR